GGRDEGRHRDVRFRRARHLRREDPGRHAAGEDHAGRVRAVGQGRLAAAQGRDPADARRRLTASDADVRVAFTGKQGTVALSRQIQHVNLVGGYFVDTGTWSFA